MPAEDPVSADQATSELVRSLVAAHERERRRIAQDLHDIVGQALTSVRLHLDLVRRDPSASATVSFEADEAVDLVDIALRQVRDLAFAIRPAIIDDLGLIVAAEALVARQARIGGFVAEFHADGPLPDVGPEAEAACFRTLQEALTNVIRHATATRVDVAVTLEREALVLIVDDDGVGFDASPTIDFGTGRPTLGLRGVRERIAVGGGDLTIRSAPGLGTTLRATFPFAAEPTPARLRA